MTIAALILIPAASGLLSFWLPSQLGRRALLVAAAVMHLGLTLSLWSARPEPTPGSWLAVDTPGLLFLTIASTLFMASAIYCTGYLSHEDVATHIDREERFLFSNEPESVFIGCLLLFLASMTLVTLSQHFGLLWVGVEATTLASAPLIYFHRNHRSLEATWKYLLICSVGIALALMGNFVLAVSASAAQAHDVNLHVTNLLANASKLDGVWLKAAFLFFLVGYGTKMGLAPMHTWLPDAHSEAPSPVSALLSGALLNCAFLGIFRVHQLCTAAGEGEFSRSLLVVFGLMSMSVAAVFILRARDFKRMLAYSSVEHMGILAIGVGLGGAGVLGAIFHAFNHSFTKAALFLAAGNILLVYDTKSINDVRGVQRRLPITGALWLAGFLAITGTPPFGTFLSEFTVLRAALDADRAVVATLYLVLLAIIFIGMANVMLKMSQGTAPESTPNSSKDKLVSVGPSLVLASLVFMFGFYIPKPLRNAFDEVTLSVREKKDSLEESATIVPLRVENETLTAISTEVQSALHEHGTEPKTDAEEIRE